MKPWMLRSFFTALSILTAMPVLAQTATSPDDRPSRSNGDDRPGIEHIQKALKENGHDPGRIDGRMGPRTRAALRAYQKEEGLKATGRLDDATRAKLARREGVSGTEQRPGRSSTKTGGDAKPSAVDPAEAGKTGANVGEGASYSRSTEKGQSTVKDGDKTK
jgi:peptidoglycan hydrolase-like protein with peptidoglycan-binding domain